MYAAGFDPNANTFNPDLSSSSQSRTPGPSKACNQCRFHKVKCDEKQPSCERCLRLGLECVYRDDFERLFRDQTKTVAEKTQKQWRSRASKSFGQASGTLGLDHEKTSSTKVSRSPTPSIQDLAIERFFYDFVIPLDETPDSRGATANGSYFAFVPGIYSSAKPGSCIVLALSAAANANFGRRCKSSQAHEQSLSNYGEALRRLSETLQAPENDVSFDVLATVCLLGMHDHIATPNGGERISWSAHAIGAAALLKTKYEAEPDVHEIAGLFQTILVKMLIGSISQGKRPPVPLEVCLSLMPSNTASAMLLCYTYKTAEICADWSSTQTAYSNNQTQLFRVATDITTRGQALDEEMMTWINDTPEAGGIQRLENCDSNVPGWLWPLYSSAGAPKVLHKYPSIHISHRWQFWRASRLTLLSTVISAIDVLVSFAKSRSNRDIYPPLKKVLELRVLDLVDGVCEGAFTAFTISIPNKPEAGSFQDVLSVRGYQLLWPLRRALMCIIQMDLHQADVSSRLQWIRSTLSCIRDDLGFQAASGIVENTEHQDATHGMKDYGPSRWGEFMSARNEGPTLDLNHLKRA